MDGGVIVEEGTPEEVFDNPQHERTKDFLGHIGLDRASTRYARDARVCACLIGAAHGYLLL